MIKANMITGQNILFTHKKHVAFLFLATFAHWAHSNPSDPYYDTFLDHELDIACTRSPRGVQSKPTKKPYTMIVYMAARNDLRNFATRNLKQMTSIGSSEYINIVVHLDIELSGNKRTTRRYLVEKDRLLHMNAHESDDYALDSGDPATLVSCCEWAIKNFPADDYALIFWNHGSGIIDPERGRVINPAELFSFNPANHKLELDRSVGYLDLIDAPDFKKDQRGICWDEAFGNYLTNQKLERALKQICNELLDGKKLSIIGFDACLMSMIEVADLLEPYAEIMVGSQEVELGTGWNYAQVLYPLAQQHLNKYEFATHIVHTYEKTYKSITYDYTQSAIFLSKIPELTNNVHQVAHLLLEATTLQSGYSVKNAVREARKKTNCTHFDEPSYIDLHHFYKNLLAQIPNITLQNSAHDAEFKAALKAKLETGLRLISGAVIANACGSNLSQAKGLSIYFPERKPHQSYGLTTFSTDNAWPLLIGQYSEPHRELLGAGGLLQ